MQDERVGVRLAGKLRKLLELEANINNITLSEAIRRILEKWAKRQK